MSDISGLTYFVNFQLALTLANSSEERWSQYQTGGFIPREGDFVQIGRFRFKADRVEFKPNFDEIAVFVRATVAPWFAQEVSEETLAESVSLEREVRQALEENGWEKEAR